MKHFLLLCTLFCGIALSALAAIGDKAAYPSFSDGHFSGEEITAEDLRGKVVLFHYWGVQCGPCEIAMPRVVKMLWRYGDEDFIIVGSHVQTLEEEKMRAHLKEKHAYFPVYIRKWIANARLSCGLPCGVLIGADGRIIGHDDPLCFVYKDELMGKAMAEAAKGYPILCDVELEKYKNLRKAIVSKGRDIESTMAPVRAAAEGGEAEAVAVCAAYDAWLESEKKRIHRLCEASPLRAYHAMQHLKRAVPSVTEFDGKAHQIKEHPTYRKLMAADKKLQGMKERMEKGKQITPKAFASLRKEIESIRKMEGIGVEMACNRLEALIALSEEHLAEMEKAAQKEKDDKKAATDKDAKKRKKGKRERKGRKGNSDTSA